MIRRVERFRAGAPTTPMRWAPSAVARTMVGAAVAVACASAGTPSEAGPLVPVYDSLEDVGCAFESLSTIEARVRFRGSQFMEGDISRALAEAGARAEAHAVVRTQRRIEVPFTVQVEGPNAPPPSPDEMEQAMRGQTFTVEGLAIRFTEPCPEAGFEAVSDAAAAGGDSIE